MTCLVGVDLPREKCVEIALAHIHGIRRTRAKETLESTGVSPDIRVKDLTEGELIKLRDFIQANHKVESDSCREVAADTRRRTGINCYQGRRHRVGPPVRGQCIKINARIRRGPRHTVASKKKAK